MMGGRMALTREGIVAILDALRRYFLHRLEKQESPKRMEEMTL